MKLTAPLPDDIDTLVWLRLLFLQELGTLLSSFQLEHFVRATDAYICKKLSNGEFIARVALLERADLFFPNVLLIRENFSGREAYIMNMYTCPEYRGQGIAMTMLREFLHRIKQIEARFA